MGSWQELLGLDRIGVTDNFFGLGGDSIKIIRLISVVNKQFDTKISLEKFYQNPTILNLMSLILVGGKTELEDVSIRLIIEKELDDIALSVLRNHPSRDTIENVYPMSDIQVGMVLTSDVMRAAGELGVYHDQMVSQVGALDPSLMEKALSLMVAKHEILRTSFHLYDYIKPVQIVNKESPIIITVEDISEKTDEQRRNRISVFLEKEREENPFDINTAPLWRVHIFQVNASDSIFVFQFHHAIIDGWSDKSFRSELMETYLALAQDINHHPRALSLGIKESVISDLIELRREDNIEYWKYKLHGYKRLDVLSREPYYHETEIIYNQDFYEKIVAKCKADRIAPKSLFFAGYLYILSLFSLEKDITIGIVTHRRPIAEDGDKLLGCFLNTVPFRFQMDTIGTYTWLEYVRAIELELQQQKGRDRFSLLEISKLHNESSQNNPFFDVIFNYVDFHIIDKLIKSDEFETHTNQKKLQDLLVKGFERTNTFLDFTTDLTGNELVISINQTKRLKSNRSLDDLLTYLDSFLNNYLNDSRRLIESLTILPQEEQYQLLEGFQGASVEYPRDKTVLGCFQEQVFKSPESIAVVFGDAHLTYRELDERSNQLGHYLIERGVKKETLVPICLERSLDMIVGILGILKAGGAYVPIDTGYPLDRIKFVLKEYQVKYCTNPKKFDFIIYNDQRRSICGMYR